MDTIKQKLFSPRQAFASTLLGGPLAAIYCVYENNKTLDDAEITKNTVIMMATFAVTIFVICIILSFLSKGFLQSSGTPVAIAICVGAKFVVEKLQYSKEKIADSVNYTFQSNWKAFFVGLISLVVTFGLIYAVVCLVY